MGLSKLLKYALVISIVLGVSFQALAEKDPREDVEIVAMRLPVDLDITAHWTQCTDVNGWYFPGTKDIFLCKANIIAGLGVARFVFLHELGHAYTYSRGLDYERWDGNYEAAADEWAALWSVVQGNPKDLLAMADVFERWGRMYSQATNDPHPPAQERATKLRRLYYGYKYPWSVYGDEWRDTMRHWKQELLAHESL